MLKRVLWLMICVVLVQPVGADEETSLTVRDAWIRAAPPAVSVTAGYLVIENASDTPRVLVGAASSAFGMVELHRTVTEEGMSRMVEQTKIEIAPRSSMEMKPGGIHMMLMGAARQLTVDDVVPLRLLFEDGSEIEVSMPVRRSGNG